MTHSCRVPLERGRVEGSTRMMSPSGPMEGGLVTIVTTLLDLRGGSDGIAMTITNLRPDRRGGRVVMIVRNPPGRRDGHEPIDMTPTLPTRVIAKGCYDIGARKLG